MIQCRTVDDHVLDNRVGSGTEWLQLDGLSFGEVEQALLAGRGVLARAVRTAVDGQTTGTTDALTAVRSESEGLFAALNVALVDVVQQLQDGHLLRGVIHLDGLEVAFLGRSGLTPDLKCQFHYL